MSEGAPQYPQPVLSKVARSRFADGILAHKAGRLAEAEQAYRDVLSLEPRHADSHHWLAVAALQVGRADVAVTLARQAIALNDQLAPYHAVLGDALTGLGQADEAKAAHERAKALMPQGNA